MSQVEKKRRDLPRVDGIVWRSGAPSRSRPQEANLSTILLPYPLRASLTKYFRETCVFSTRTEVLQESGVVLHRLVSIRNDFYRGLVPNLLCAGPWLAAAELSWPGKPQPVSPMS